MTVYLYQDVETGERFTLERSMSEAPDTKLEMEGRTLRRVYAAPIVQKPKYDNGDQKYPDGSPIGDRGLGRNWPFARNHDKKGRPLFANKSERDEAHSRANHAGELLSAADLSQPGTPETGRMFVDR